MKTTAQCDDKLSMCARNLANLDAQKSMKSSRARKCKVNDAPEFTDLHLPLKTKVFIWIPYPKNGSMSVLKAVWGGVRRGMGQTSTERATPLFWLRMSDLGRSSRLRPERLVPVTAKPLLIISGLGT